MESNLCAAFMHLFAREEETSVDDDLERIDATLRTLHEDATNNRAALMDLKRSLQTVTSTEVPFRSSSISRAGAERMIKMRMKGHLHTAKVLEQQITFFERTRVNLVSSQMAEEMATNIATLRERAGLLRHVDLDRLQADMDEIEDINVDARAANEAVADAMQLGARGDDVDDDRLLAEFLAEDGEEEKAERVGAPEAPRRQRSPRREEPTWEEARDPIPL